MPSSRHDAGESGDGVIIILPRFGPRNDPRPPETAKECGQEEETVVRVRPPPSEVGLQGPPIRMMPTSERKNVLIERNDAKSRAECKAELLSPDRLSFHMRGRASSPMRTLSTRPTSRGRFFMLHRMHESFPTSKEWPYASGLRRILLCEVCRYASVGMGALKVNPKLSPKFPIFKGVKKMSCISRQKHLGGR